jgi:small subunit ribosomal protein S2
MPEVSMKNMMEAGVHFGHQTHRWNPKMKAFIFGPRNGIYIIDLEKTVRYTTEAVKFVKDTVGDGGKILFVATKKQSKHIAKEAAARAGMPYVTERWLGGTLTNFMTIRKGCDRLDELDQMRADGTFDALPKKEVIGLERKYKKLDLSLGGIREMRSLPAALFVIDPETERIAVREANRLGIPVVAVVDTNCDPDSVDFVIPGNDDAIKSVTLFVNLIADSCMEGAAVFEQKARVHGGQNAAPQQARSEQPQQPKGPVVEKVVRKQLRNIPTEIDYRAEAQLLEEDEPVTAAPVAEGEAAAAAEGTEAVVEDKAVTEKPAVKPAKPGKKDKK